MTVPAGTTLWTPPATARQTTRLGRFLDGVQERTGRVLPDYESAWRWSVEELEEFWAEVWNWADVISHRPPERVLGRRDMPFAQWFPGATLNYAEHALRWPGASVRVHARSQTRAPTDLTGDELAELVGRAQQGLRAAGVGHGDRVVGYLPNIPEALVVHLAAAGLGAIWCSVPAEMGARSVLDRVSQLDPTLLVCVDGYRWGTKTVDRAEAVASVRAGLRPDLTVVQVPYLSSAAPPPAGALSWRQFTADSAPATYEPLPFDHPLVVLFSSGTTGLPKAIVHSHGGLLLEHAKALGLQMDIGEGDTGFWYTTTGWMVWNLLVSGLVVGATVVLFDGDPGWPDLSTQWVVAAETGATLFGTSAGYLAACSRAGLTPGADLDLSALREVTSSGSALTAAAAAWVYEAVGPDLLLASTSGGTDVCSGFVGGSPLSPVHAGEMSCRPLGVATESFDPNGKPLVGEPGELVVTEPMPSMPIGFWGDADGSRYTAAYFDTYPGIWRHGDWLVHTERDTWVVSGRSDATLNRGGVRLGTAEFYSVLDALPEVFDSVVLHLEDPDTAHGWLIVVVAAGATPAEGLPDRVRGALREQLSPRHSPDRVLVTSALSRNSNGKRLEVPLKRVVQGLPVGKAVDMGSLTDPDAFVAAAALVRSTLDLDERSVATR
ncbi:acetoacetate--CoA ligase [Blastococcus saxobsidens]|uniref:Acetoacetate--CoA ligase n=1 Tax=Blastococcus saxobsidens TaxID=138336 RepID=A0A6L9W4Z3_9ACTN|nr:acetoacetate--CoA ligase [Blastococcus saxobsidens]NEK86869.1 acetoacetate--CoA ligase [Blastococcus saxobsidens]